ncbi:MAG: heme o synthase [Thermoplasmatota archaeon]
MTPRGRFRLLALLASASALSVVLIGGYVTSTASGLGCGDDWPACNGKLVPDLASRAITIEYTHRVAAVVLGALGLSLLLTTIAQRKSLPGGAAKAVYLAAGLFASQALLGALIVKNGLKPELVAIHTTIAASIFASLVTAFILAKPGATAKRDEERAATASASASVTVPVANTPASAPKRTARDVAADYFELIKPGILFLLVFAGLAAMLVASGPAHFSATLAIAGLGGGALSASGASVLNHYLERDLDAKMRRTARRPIASGRVKPSHGLAFAILLTALSVAVLARWVNWLSAWLSLAGFGFYVLVYTLGLKRTTPQNIVIGGAAGVFPALVGWAAVTNSVSVAAIVMGALVFLWTPPHFWALAVAYKDDYARAGFPMLPNVATAEETRRQIVLYSVLLVAASLALYWPLHSLGLVYFATAAVLGGAFLWLCVRLYGATGPKPYMRLFAFSIVYLGALYGAMILDRLL